MKYEKITHNNIDWTLTENNIKHRKIVRYGIVTFILETILIGIWFYTIKPKSDAALDIFPSVFLLSAFNLILGLLFYFLKKSYASLFFANALICPLIFYAIWIMWFLFYAQYPS